MECRPLKNGARIVFTDVDGTLLDAEHRPIPASASAIARLGERGIPFVLVSARMPEALTPIQRTLRFSGPLVCYSGAYATDERGVELLSRPMPIELALKASRIVAERASDVCCMAYGYHRWVVDDRLDPRVANEERIVGRQSEEGTLEDVFGEVGGLHKLLLVGEAGRMGALRAELAAALPELTVVLSSPILCEIMAGGVSKAEGVRVVCEQVWSRRRPWLLATVATMWTCLRRCRRVMPWPMGRPRCGRPRRMLRGSPMMRTAWRQSWSACCRPR